MSDCFYIIFIPIFNSKVRYYSLSDLRSVVVSARCFYLAKSYSSSGKRAEAYALYCHSYGLAKNAIQKLKTSSNPDKVHDYSTFLGTLIYSIYCETLNK